MRLRAGLDRCGKFRRTGIRSPDRPARSESLYRLGYPGSSYLSAGQFLKSFRKSMWLRPAVLLRGVSDTMTFISL